VRFALGSRHVAVFTVAASLAAAGVWYVARDDAAAAVAGSFQTQPASVGRIESIVNTAGTIRPVVIVEVGSELSGLISELNADFNSEVTSGQVIARIDDRTIRTRLRQIEADIVSARANQEQQRANVNRARADLDLARSEVARLRELTQRQLVSQAETDKAEANLKIADAQLEVANAQLTAAGASILQREAQLEQVNLDLERSYIRSPVDGMVINRQVDVGQTVAASLTAPTLFEIAQDLTKMQIEADVDEADIGQIRDGLSARFTVDAHPNRTFDGTVRQVRKAATVTNNVVTYKVIIDMQPGRVWVLEKGAPKRVRVLVGLSDAQYTEVRSQELAAGDEVIVRLAR
jgi:HlyD family secretion protein